ncbi:MAG: hypothetical protein WCC84_00125 [Candidatus Cybelea sp.]
MRVSQSGLRAATFAAAVALTLCLFATVAARAEGTLTIQQADGDKNVYQHVAVKVIHSALYLTSADGKGTLVINRAACAYQGKVMVCLPTSAALVQSGTTSALDFQKGTVYLNSTDDEQQLSASTTKIAPHSIVLSFTTDRGTYVNLIGQIDKVVK